MRVPISDGSYSKAYKPINHFWEYDGRAALLREYPESHTNAPFYSERDGILDGASQSS